MPDGMQTTIESFGFKHGLPLDVDMVIDCRFLPNPHWVEALREHTGLEEPVRDYVLGQATKEFLERLESLLDLLLPAYAAEGKSYLTDRLRLHRRPPPVGRHRRGGGGSAAAQGHQPRGSAPRHRRPVSG